MADSRYSGYYDLSSQQPERAPAGYVHSPAPRYGSGPGVAAAAARYNEQPEERPFYVNPTLDAAREFEEAAFSPKSSRQEPTTNNLEKRWVPVPTSRWETQEQHQQVYGHKPIGTNSVVAPPPARTVPPRAVSAPRVEAEQQDPYGSHQHDDDNYGGTATYNNRFPPNQTQRTEDATAPPPVPLPPAGAAVGGEVAVESHNNHHQEDLIWCSLTILEEGFDAIEVEVATLGLFADRINVAVPKTNFTVSVFHKDVVDSQPSTERRELVLHTAQPHSLTKRQYVLVFRDASIVPMLHNLIAARVEKFDSVEEMSNIRFGSNNGTTAHPQQFGSERGASTSSASPSRSFKRIPTMHPYQEHESRSQERAAQAAASGMGFALPIQRNDTRDDGGNPRRPNNLEQHSSATARGVSNGFHNTTTNNMSSVNVSSASESGPMSPQPHIPNDSHKGSSAAHPSPAAPLWLLQRRPAEVEAHYTLYHDSTATNRRNVAQPTNHTSSSSQASRLVKPHTTTNSGSNPPPPRLAAYADGNEFVFDALPPFMLPKKRSGSPSVYRGDYPLPPEAHAQGRDDLPEHYHEHAPPHYNAEAAGHRHQEQEDAPNSLQHQGQTVVDPTPQQHQERKPESLYRGDTVTPNTSLKFGGVDTTPPVANHTATTSVAGGHRHADANSSALVSPIPQPSDHLADGNAVSGVTDAREAILRKHEAGEASGPLLPNREPPLSRPLPRNGSNRAPTGAETAPLANNVTKAVPVPSKQQQQREKEEQLRQNQRSIADPSPAKQLPPSGKAPPPRQRPNPAKLPASRTRSSVQPNPASVTEGKSGRAAPPPQQSAPQQQQQLVAANDDEDDFVDAAGAGVGNATTVTPHPQPSQNDGNHAGEEQHPMKRFDSSFGQPVQSEVFSEASTADDHQNDQFVAQGAAEQRHKPNPKQVAADRKEASRQRAMQKVKAVSYLASKRPPPPPKRVGTVTITPPRGTTPEAELSNQNGVGGHLDQTQTAVVSQQPGTSGVGSNRFGPTPKKKVVIVDGPVPERAASHRPPTPQHQTASFTSSAKIGDSSSLTSTATASRPPPPMHRAATMQERTQTGSGGQQQHPSSRGRQIPPPPSTAPSSSNDADYL